MGKGFCHRCRLGGAPVAGLSHQSVTPNLLHDDPGILSEPINWLRVLQLALTSYNI